MCWFWIWGMAGAWKSQNRDLGESVQCIHLLLQSGLSAKGTRECLEALYEADVEGGGEGGETHRREHHHQVLEDARDTQRLTVRQVNTATQEDGLLGYVL